MLKYLTRRDNYFWYRRKIQGIGEIVFSLQTKNYNAAVIRHSYIDFKIKQLAYRGAFEIMTVQEIRELIGKYKKYMLEEEYNNFEDTRDKELTLSIEGKTYGGHTKEALAYAINRYSSIHSQNNLDLVKEETVKILERSNFTKEDLAELKTEQDNMIFHWELLKAEWELLQKAYDGQKEVTYEVKKELTPEEIKSIYAYQAFCNDKEFIKSPKSITISELLNIYIEENVEAKAWSDKNRRDLVYIFKHLASYYNDKDINELKREHFSQFRDNVLRNLPERPRKKGLEGKNTIEVIKYVKNKNLKKINLDTINKHLKRVHQIFEWACNTGKIEKNLTKDLKLKDKQKSKKKKAAKIPYSKEDLQKLFNSPWYTEELAITLKYKPQNIFIPILALYTGAKPAELGTLKLSAIKKINEIWVIDFNQMVKTTSSERLTPLSQTLLNIGFLEYVKYQTKQKETLLFPSIKVYGGGGINFTNEFSKYNHAHITKESDKTFYSIRHLVNQLLKNKKTPSYIINDIIGHSQDAHDMDSSVYGAKQMPEEILRDTINECLVYDYLDFSKIKETIINFYK